MGGWGFIGEVQAPAMQAGHGHGGSVAMFFGELAGRRFSIARAPCRCMHGAADGLWPMARHEPVGAGLTRGGQRAARARVRRPWRNTAGAPHLRDARPPGPSGARSHVQSSNSPRMRGPRAACVPSCLDVRADARGTVGRRRVGRAAAADDLQQPRCHPGGTPSCCAGERSLSQKTTEPGCGRARRRAIPRFRGRLCRHAIVPGP